jgi:hypothetical protein
MDAQEKDKNEIIALAKIAKFRCDLLIAQSDNWLSEEEGQRNVVKRLKEIRKKEK